MPNYYEILQIQPDAPAPEIEAACEAQYNRWRRLVTHHDPETADKATRALRIIEQIRATLTDPTKRAAYDATLDLSGTVGGLADPQAQPARPVAPPVPPRPPTAPQAATPTAPAARLDAWLCPKCHSASPVGTRYCRHCGEEIGRPCPKCAKLIEKTIRFCPECGVEVEAYIAEKQREAEEFARRQQEEARRQAEERVRREAQEREQRRRRNRVIGYVVGLLAIVVLVWVAVSSISQAVQQRQYQIRATATAVQYYVNATATVEQHYANATATTEAILSAGGQTRRDGMMVYVPAGQFYMGSNNAEAKEKPRHRVILDAFWIDLTEVTNVQYRKCVEAGVCTPVGVCTSNVSRSHNEANGDDYPVICVSWSQAYTYCKWVGAELPTEAQWEYAARGPQNFIYPWGNSWRAQVANCTESDCTDGYEYTAPVGSFPEGASWVGALDMVGNVAEWTSNWFYWYEAKEQTNPEGPLDGVNKVVRGGAWTGSNDSGSDYDVRTTARALYTLFPHDDVIGFRCITAQLLEQ